MIGEEAAVGVGEVEEAADAVVDLGLDGDQAGGEVGVLALPVGRMLSYGCILWLHLLAEWPILMDIEVRRETE